MTIIEETDRSVAAARSVGPWRRFLRATRAWISRHPRTEAVYRVGVAAVGTPTVGLGLILVPLPGPGWLVVFLGLAILGSEFGWAARAAGGLRRLLDRVLAWWRTRRQRRIRPSA